MKMAKDLLSGGDTSLARSTHSPTPAGGQVRNRLHQQSAAASSLPRNISSRIPSPASSHAKIITAKKTGKQRPSSAPAGPGALVSDPSLPELARRTSECRYAFKDTRSLSKAECQPWTASPLPSTRQQQTPTSNSTSAQQTSVGITPPSNTCSSATETPLSTPSDNQSSSASPRVGPVEDQMQFPSLPSTSRVRNRCSQAFSLRSSTEPVTPTTSTKYSTRGTSSSQTPATSRSATFPNTSTSLSSSSTPSTTDTLSSSQPTASPSSSTSTPRSSSSIRMLLFRRQKRTPVTYKGLEISAPFPEQDIGQMREVSGLRTEGSVNTDMYRNPAYEGLRAATPPTPVLYPPKEQDRTDTIRGRSASASGIASIVNGRSEMGRSSKWSLFRSDSTQSKHDNIRSPIAQANDVSRSIQLPSQVAMSDSGSSVKASAISFSRELPQPHPSRHKQSCQSWSSRLLTKSRSTFNLNQAAGTISKKAVGPPLRPPRPAESANHSADPHRTSSSLTNSRSQEASARINSYGWQNIKPLPGRNGLKLGEVSGSRRRESVVSGSWYLTDGGDAERLHSPDTIVEAKTRIDKHRKAAFGALDKKTSMKAVDIKGKTPIRPPTISSHISTKNSNSNKQARARLTAVTEEDSEPDYDKPLPAPPSSANEPQLKDPTPVRRKKSQVILTSGQYKPWWEEQGIKENDLCFEVDEAQHSSLEAQAPSTERSQPSSDDKSETTSTESPEKSMLLTEIARSYVEEQERAEDRERQERYRKEMRGKRLGMQIVHELPAPKNRTRVQSGDGKGKWRFSVFENEIESRPSTANNSSGSSLKDFNTAKGIEAAKPNATASASTLTLPETEKLKLRPLPLRVNTARANQTLKPIPTVASTKERAGLSHAKQSSALPAPTKVHREKQKQHPSTKNRREAAMRLSDGTPVRSPKLIRRNGEVLLPPKEEQDSVPPMSPVSPISPFSERHSPSSSKFWSHDGDSQDTEKQPDTPPTANAVHYEHKDDTMGGDGDGDDGSDILDFYLDQYSADIPPAVPDRSPRRRISQTPVKSDGNSRASTGTTGSNPFRDELEEDDDEDEERRRWEEEERRKRVAAILGRLRAKTSYPVMD